MYAEATVASLPALGRHYFHDRAGNDMMARLRSAHRVLVDPDAAHVADARRRGYHAFRLGGLGETAKDAVNIVWVEPHILVNFKYVAAHDTDQKLDRSGRFVGVWDKLAICLGCAHLEDGSNGPAEWAMRGHMSKTRYSTVNGICEPLDLRHLIPPVPLGHAGPSQPASYGGQSSRPASPTAVSHGTASPRRSPSPLSPVVSVSTPSAYRGSTPRSVHGHSDVEMGAHGELDWHGRPKAERGDGRLYDGEVSQLHVFEADTTAMCSVRGALR